MRRKSEPSWSRGGLARRRGATGKFVGPSVRRPGRPGWKASGARPFTSEAARLEADSASGHEFVPARNV